MYRAVSVDVSLNDRFIPRRLGLDVHFRENLPPLQLENEDNEFVNLGKKRYCAENYRRVLREFLCPPKSRVLNFFPPRQFLSEFCSEMLGDWPVKPRKKPLITPPDIVLDMPDLDSSICHHVADWSGSNHLATIFENEVHIWNAQTMRVTRTHLAVCNCVKWKSDGVCLAVGILPNMFAIWDTSTESITSAKICCHPYCEIYCLEWANNNHLITGCCNGVLRIYSSKMKHVATCKKAHNCGIVNLVCSCNKKSVASSSLDGTVIVSNTENLVPYYRLKFKSVVRCLAWHPWKSFLLALCCESKLYLFNVFSKEVIAKKIVTPNLPINCLTFNPLSAEIVISYFEGGNEDTKANGYIAVLTNMDTVVEEIKLHNGVIPYLLWGHGGRVLASVSTDERLCMLKFFGTTDNKPSAKGAFFNASKFRECIR